jgi:hypothetical protein
MGRRRIMTKTTFRLALTHCVTTKRPASQNFERREYAMEMQAESKKNDECEGLLENFRAELRQYFGQDCTSVWLAGDRYRSALNRLHDLNSGESRA